MISIIKNNKILRTALIFSAWLLIWQFAVTILNKGLLIGIPTPVSTCNALISLLNRKDFYEGVLFSVVRISVGFLCALFLGTLAALLSSTSPFLMEFFSPLIRLLRAVPVAALTIVVFLWVGREIIPTCIVFLTVFPMIWTNIYQGLREKNKQLLEMAEVYRLPKRSVLEKIILPSLKPYLISSVETGLGFSWKAGVAVEIICRTGKSLGNSLWAGKSIIDYDSVFAVTLVIIALSTVMQRLLVRAVTRRQKNG